MLAAEAVHGDRVAAGRVRLEAHDRRRAGLRRDFDVVAVQMQLDPLVRRPAQLDGLAFLDADDRLLVPPQGEQGQWSIGTHEDADLVVHQLRSPGTQVTHQPSTLHGAALEPDSHLFANLAAGPVAGE